MANPKINISSLDFDSIKNVFKDLFKWFKER